MDSELPLGDSVAVEVGVRLELLCRAVEGAVVDDREDATDCVPAGPVLDNTLAEVDSSLDREDAAAVGVRLELLCEEVNGAVAEDREDATDCVPAGPVLDNILAEVDSSLDREDVAAVIAVADDGGDLVRPGVELELELVDTGRALDVEPDPNDDPGLEAEVEAVVAEPARSPELVCVVTGTEDAGVDIEFERELAAPGLALVTEVCPPAP